MCGIFTLFTLATIFLFTYKKDEKRFENITNQLFIEEMKSNTLNMHYTIAHPENFGIYDYTPILSGYSKKNSLTLRMSTENLLNSLYKLKPDRLSEDENYTYRLLTRSLENSLALSEYSYYDEPLSPSSGAQSQLPILLAEYTFRDKKDVEDYLAILSQTGDYFRSLLTYEYEKKEAGLLMSAASMEKVITQCDTIITSDDLEAGNHFLQTTFAERMELLRNSNLITEEQAVFYSKKNDEILKNVLLKAYRELGDGLLALKDDSISTCGISTKPNGQDYYQLYLISQTGSYRNIDEIKKMLLSTFTTELNTIKDMSKANPQAVLLYANDIDDTFSYMDADTMLGKLRACMAEDFPDIPYLSDVTPLPAVKSVSPSLERYCAPAFYLTAPLDDADSNVIYINQKNSPNGLELFTTLAHEGYPGHLYQTVFNNNYSLSNDINNVRRVLWYGGYLEGWAMYVEFISYDYASELLADEGLTDASIMVQLKKHNRSLQLCLYSLLDIMINYEGASPERVGSVLKSLGIDSPSATDTVYSYIAEEPCNYLKYYLGYLEILQLKEYAMQKMSSDYSDLAFHTFFLESGPSDFTSLRERFNNLFYDDLFYKKSF